MPRMPRFYDLFCNDQSTVAIGHGIRFPICVSYRLYAEASLTLVDAALLPLAVLIGSTSINGCNRDRQGIWRRHGNEANPPQERDRFFFESSSRSTVAAA